MTKNLLSSGMIAGAVAGLVMALPVSYTHLDVYKRQPRDHVVRARRHGLGRADLCGLAGLWP